MRLASVHVGDIVKCDVKGRRFYALVDGRGERSLAITPIDPRTTYRLVTSSQVIEHYRKSRPRLQPAAPGQTEEVACSSPR